MRTAERLSRAAPALLGLAALFFVALPRPLRRGGEDEAELREQRARLEWLGPLGALHRTLAAPLREARRAPAEREELLARLTAPGADAIAPLVDILVEERVPRAAPEDAPQLLSVPQRELLLAALAALPRPALRVELERRLAPRDALAGAPQRLAALRLFALVGARADWPRLAHLATHPQGELDPQVAEALRTACAALLRREPALLARGQELLRGMDGECAQQLVFALADLRDPRTLPLLEDLLRSRRELAQAIVALLPQIGRSGEADLDQRLADWLAGNLDPERVEWTRAALRALGVFDDGRQVPVLLEALEAEQPVLREAALEALRRISGLKLRESPPAWREWYAGERAWLAEREPAARLELASRQDARVARALDEFAAHRLFREERVAAVIEVLERGSQAMRVLACETLARIGSPSALPELLERCSSDSPALAEAARRAACELSGGALAHNCPQGQPQPGTGRE